MDTYNWDIIAQSESYEEYRIQCDLQGIPQIDFGNTVDLLGNWNYYGPFVTAITKSIVQTLLTDTGAIRITQNEPHIYTVRLSHGMIDFSVIVVDDTIHITGYNVCCQLLSR